MIIFGITGSIAVGKSTVSNFFAKAGVSIIDADIVARQVVEPGTPGLASITEKFGHQYLNDDGTLNRIKLGSLVFNDQEQLNSLNSIMRVIIQKECSRQFNNLYYNGHKIVAMDAALLIENGDVDRFRPLVVVACPVDLQLTRLMKRNMLSESEARARIGKQLSTEEKIKYADFIIDTSGSLIETEQQTKTILKQIESKFS